MDSNRDTGGPALIDRSRYAQMDQESLIHEIDRLASDNARLTAERDQLKAALMELKRYFISANGVPVERASIRAGDFWRITGLSDREVPWDLQTR